MLSYIFEKIFLEGVFPREWLHSSISPLHKNLSKSFIENYRPISHLSSLSKIFERIIYNQLSSHLQNNNILSPLQFGFTKNRSVEMQLALTNRLINISISRFGFCHVFYLDFRKAFDRVNTDTLIFKLSKLGLSDSVFSLLSTYLKNRTFSVTYDGFSSKTAPVLSGVPQGSVLGPLLFLIYVNDLLLVPFRNIKIVMFADDTKLISCSASPCGISDDIVGVENWIKLNSLELNTSKCKFVNYGKIVCHNYSIFSQKILPTDSVRDLGVLYDRKLKFSEHLQYVLSKCKSKIFLIHKLFRSLNKFLLLTLYFSLVRSIAEFGSMVWFPISNSHISELEGIQKLFISKTFKSLGNKNYDEKLKILKIDSLQLRFKMKVFTAIAGLTNDPILLNLFDLKLSTILSTRGNDMKILKPVEFKKSNVVFVLRFLNLWNNLNLCGDEKYYNSKLKLYLNDN